MSDKLKPCPFCGGEPNIANSVEDFSIGVDVTEDCGFLGLSSRTRTVHRKPKYQIIFEIGCCGFGFTGDSEYEVIKKWNKRKSKKITGEE